MHTIQIGPVLRRAAVAAAMLLLPATAWAQAPANDSGKTSAVSARTRFAVSYGTVDSAYALGNAHLATAKRYVGAGEYDSILPELVAAREIHAALLAAHLDQRATRQFGRILTTTIDEIYRSCARDAELAKANGTTIKCRF